MSCVCIKCSFLFMYHPLVSLLINFAYQEKKDYDIIMCFSRGKAVVTTILDGEIKNETFIFSHCHSLHRDAGIPPIRK